MNKIRKRRSKAAWIPFWVLLLVVAIHVFLDRLYELKTHAALGFAAAYSTIMTFELATRYGVALACLFLAWWAVRPFAEIVPTVAYGFIRTGACFLGWVVGYGLGSLNATDWMLFFRHHSFPVSDPIFHLNEAFYVYQLPLLIGAIGRLCVLVGLFLLARGVFLAVLFVRQQFITTGARLPALITAGLRAVFFLGGILFLGFTALSVLNRYELAVTSGNGTFLFGPDFVTAKLTIPIFTWIHTGLLLITAVLLFRFALRVDPVLGVREGFAVLQFRGLRGLVYAFGAYIASLLLTAVVGGLVNGLYVHPNQNTVELPYIRNTIDATRWALGLDRVAVKTFQPATTLTASSIQKDQSALDNVRVNDQGQTTAIYNQLQSFKSYFHFDAASVDRYQDKEVYTSARQMDVSKLPVQTWVNRTLVYTHGYGLAISPVNQVDSDGLPAMWAKDTPIVTQPPIPAITRPQIYFGSMTNDVIAPSKQPEFDYPVGSTDHTSTYKGGYGLPIAGNRLLLAIEQGSLKYFTSDQITNQSQLLFDRNIYQRVQDIAPFLRFDQDVFPFVDSQGHILWMLDAYTTSSNIPYAQNFMNTAYIRNSVKVVMDAYTGQVTFYVVDPTDPILESLMALYPSMFTTQIPPDIAVHFRYPQDLFAVQAQALSRYHMTEPSAFYNQEDLWAVANQIYQQNQTSPRPPVYQMIRMPDQDAPRFVLSSLFTPANKDNLNGWFVADNTPGSYGQLTVYQFPQSSLIFGPMQAENQIDSNPAISAQLSLWNQQGSRVVRGDLLLIPVGDTILYVEPVYLVASRENSLPQLERVIVDYNKQVFINTSLGAALQDLLQGVAPQSPQPNTPTPPANGGGQPQPSDHGQGGGVGAGSTGSLAAQANQVFAQYQRDTAKGDFEAAGKDLKKLGSLLSQWANATGASTAGGAPAANSTP